MKRTTIDVTALIAFIESEIERVTFEQEKHQAEKNVLKDFLNIIERIKLLPRKNEKNGKGNGNKN